MRNHRIKKAFKTKGKPMDIKARNVLLGQVESRTKQY